MNTTFDKDDEFDETIANPIHASTPQNPEDDVEENEKTLAGCTIWDVVVNKHTSKILKDLVKRLLFSDEFEVRRCSNGEIISQGRTTNSADGGASSEELQTVTKERDQARLEAQNIHENYACLYDTFTNMRDAVSDLRSGYQDASEKLKLAAAEVEEWKAKFLAVKESANQELERASLEYDDLVKSHDENTKMLRLRVKKMEIEMNGKSDEISNLKNRVNELTQICDQLINEVDVCDTRLAEKIVPVNRPIRVASRPVIER